MVNQKKANEKRFEIYNKSSERMSELDNSSIDLVITDPPFNVGCYFGDMIDDSPHQEYIDKIDRVTYEIARVLSPKGLALFLVPTAVRREGNLYEYPKIYSKLCCNRGLLEIGNISYKVTEEDYDCVPESEIRDNPLKGKSHSDKIEGLIFSKAKRKFQKFPEDKFYRYNSKEGHPCPYPFELLSDLLDAFYRIEDRILDPFMGTGGLGVEVVKRGGSFVGYEINSSFYEIAKGKLEDECRKW